MMRYDCFMFNDELDLLRLRLNTLRGQVDLFVLVEAPLTHSGQAKPLHYAEHAAEFAEFPIRHVVADLSSGLDRVAREAIHRNAILQGITDAGPYDIIMISDVDEIPDMATWNGAAGTFSCRMFYYYLNVLHQNNWPGTLILPRSELVIPQDARAWHWNMPVVGTGWHYSYLGGGVAVQQKVRDFCHAEHDTPEVQAALPGRVQALIDPFGRLPDPMPVVSLEGPAWLLEHQAEYAAYIHASLSRQERIDQAIAYAKQIQGLISHYEMQWLAQAATEHQHIIEIGSWQGRSTKLLAMATDGMVYTTDNFSQSFILGNDGGYVQRQFNYNLRQQIGVGKVVHLNLPSVIAARELLPLLGQDWADMVFVDGDHRGDCAEQDIRAYWPLLRPGGLLCGHDIQDEPVRASLQRVIPNWLPAPGMLWYHVKRGEELGSF